VKQERVEIGKGFGFGGEEENEENEGDIASNLLKKEQEK